MRSEFQLGEAAREVLDNARDAHQPTQIHRERVRRAVELRLAAGATVAAGSLIGLVAAAKIAAVVAAIGIVAGGAYAVSRRAATGPVPPAPASQTIGTLPSKATEPTVPPVPARAAESAIVALAPSAGERPPSSRATASSGSDQLAAEIELLARVNQALNSGDSARAQSLLQSYDRRFSTGVLREERAAAGVLALCAAGRVEAARAAARRFQQRWPRSPLLSRLGASCARAE
jgi:hypothetical protein